ncbi:MAG TPA: hypothetical protein VFD82_02670 [Planctomycetota bacterium]|nr:hypothetical protein [Planctomycetota bacterium]
MKQLIAITSLALSFPALGQQVVVDNLGFGCQAGGPVLSGGTLASGTVDFEYLQATHVLRLVVTNTSQVTVGVPNPLITRIYFNAPAGTVDSATLLSQAGSGGATPAFVFAFDADTSLNPNPNQANCFGSFNFALVVQNIHGGIANASADTIPGPPGAAVIGPVTFELQLGGPGVNGLSAAAIAGAVSANGPQTETNVAFKFMGGGPGGAQSGVIGNGPCVTGMFIRGEPRIGNEIDVCITGSNGCHGCPWSSLFPGPTVIGTFVLPIGLPLLANWDLGDFVGGITELCLHVAIPNNPALIGVNFYFTNLTHPEGDPAAFSFSPAFHFAIVP